MEGYRVIEKKEDIFGEIFKKEVKKQGFTLQENYYNNTWYFKDMNGEEIFLRFKGSERYIELGVQSLFKTKDIERFENVFLILKEIIEEKNEDFEFENISIAFIETAKWLRDLNNELREGATGYRKEEIEDLLKEIEHLEEYSKKNALNYYLNFIEKLFSNLDLELHERKESHVVYEKTPFDSTLQKETFTEISKALKKEGIDFSSYKSFLENEYIVIFDFFDNVYEFNIDAQGKLTFEDINGDIEDSFYETILAPNDYGFNESFSMNLRNYAVKKHNSKRKKNSYI